MVTNILFDLDGTLTDPKEGITKSIVFALERLGQQPPPMDELLWCIGPPLHDIFFKMLGSEELAHKAVELYRERYSSIGMFENQVFDGIPETLLKLKERGHNLYLATSKLKSIAESILNHFGFGHYFSAVHGSELDGTRGDKGDLIAFVLRQEKLAADDCLMIGDREHDVIGALKNNVRCIGVGWGYGSVAELTNSGAVTVLSRPDELLSTSFALSATSTCL